MPLFPAVSTHQEIQLDQSTSRPDLHHLPLRKADGNMSHNQNTTMQGKPRAFALIKVPTERISVNWANSRSSNNNSRGRTTSTLVGMGIGLIRFIIWARRTGTMDIAWLLLLKRSDHLLMGISETDLDWLVDVGVDKGLDSSSRSTICIISGGRRLPPSLCRCKCKLREGKMIRHSQRPIGRKR